MGDADGDAGERAGMGGRRDGVMNWFRANVFFYVASVGSVCQRERAPQNILFEAGGCGVLQG